VYTAPVAVNATLLYPGAPTRRWFSVMAEGASPLVIVAVMAIVVPAVAVVTGA
jgi:hypothetical protein